MPSNRLTFLALALACIGAAGVGGELKQHPRRGEIAVVEGIFAAPDQRIDFITSRARLRVWRCLVERGAAVTLGGEALACANF